MKRTKLMPPVFLWTHLIAMVGLHFLWPVTQLINSPYRYFGIVPIGIGMWLNVWADRLFKQRETTVRPFEESSALILDGPFRFSRNPMYLGMVAAIIGVAIVLGSLVAFIAPVAFYLTMSVAFICHEEKAMEDTFGQEYLNYRNRVRRWI
jgi:protein-S-isoprenylcysteine O-methyltransferase Ste14